MKKSNSVTRRILSLCLALLLAASLTFITGCSAILERCREIVAAAEGNPSSGVSNVERDSLINSLGGVSETYEGRVSEWYYDSAEAAAEAFVCEQLLNASYTAIESIEYKSELKSQEIDKLNIPYEYRDGIEYVYEMEVTYNPEKVSDYTYVTPGVSQIDSLNTTKKVTVYVIKYEYNWKYFSPCPTNGDPLSIDYYDTVFNSTKYENCTLESSFDITVKAGGSYSDLLDVKMTMTQLIRYADGKVYMEQIIETEQSGETARNVIYAYMEEDSYGSVRCYVKTDESSDEWYDTYLSTIGFNSLEELTPFYDQYLDHSYFTKTEYGFRLSEESARFYLKEALSGMSDVTSVVDMDGMDVNMYADYYVQDGALTAMDLSANLTMDITEGGETVSVTEIIKGRTTCKNYGSTIVTKPFD